MSLVRTLQRRGDLSTLTALVGHPTVDAISVEVEVRNARVVTASGRRRPRLPLPRFASDRIGRSGERTALDELVRVVFAASAETGLVLELGPSWADPAPDVAQRLLELPDHHGLTVSCDSWAVAERLRAWLPDLAVAYSIRQASALERFIDRSTSRGTEGISVSVREELIRSPADVRSLAAAAGSVAAWAVDDPDRGLDLAAWGIDAIGSNHLAVLNAL